MVSNLYIETKAHLLGLSISEVVQVTQEVMFLKGLNQQEELNRETSQTRKAQVSAREVCVHSLG